MDVAGFMKKNNNMDKMGKYFSSNRKRKWYLSEIFHTQFYFDMFYAVKLSEVETKNKN